MKTLFITHYTALFGANRSLLALVDGLTNNGVDALVVVPQHGPICQELDELAVSWVVIPHATWCHVPSNRKSLVIRVARWAINATRGIFRFAKHLYAGLRIAKICRKEQIDVIHTNSIVTPVGAIAGMLAGAPHVWHIREFGDLDYHLQYDLGNSLAHKIVGQSAQILTISQSIAKHHGVDSLSNHTQIYDAIISRELADELPWNEKLVEFGGAPVMCIVGYLSATKGQDIAVRCFAEVVKSYPKAKLLIAGGGEETFEKHLRALAAELGVENGIEYLGMVDTPLDVFLRSHVTFMCSKNEGLGRVTPEAMFCGSVVVGFDNAGTSELIEHGVDGLLYKTFDEMVENVIELLKSPATMQELRVKARLKAINSYTNEEYSTAVNKVYQTVIDV